MKIIESIPPEFNAFHQAENNFFSMISDTHIDYGNLIAFATGVQASGLNPAFLLNPFDESLSTHLTACESFYIQKNLPWAFIVPEYFHDETMEHLTQHHQLTLADKGVAMTLSLKTLQIPPIMSSLKIRPMDADLSSWSLPLIYGFESTPEITEVYLKRHLLASRPENKLYHFSGFINNTIVCSLSLSVSAKNARIDDVATMPAYQKKGYATGLIYAALKYLQELKIKTCFLEASTSGFNIYKRIGFTELFKNHYYEKIS